MQRLSRRALLASFGTGAAALAVSNLGGVAGAAETTTTTVPVPGGADRTDCWVTEHQGALALARRNAH
jgi:hypothetical protein